MNPIRWSCVAAMVCLLSGAPRVFAASTPFGGSAIPIPGSIPGANFDNGGEGVAYHDTTAGNSGNTYRTTDVDIAASSEGGYTLGWITAGEWVNYTVTAGAGSYTATIRIASPNGGGSLHIGFNGPSNVWKTVSIPKTGGWQAWTDVVVPVTLGSGVQQMTLLFDTAGYNVSKVTVTGSGTSTPPPPNGSTPYSGTALTIPGTIPAANFDNGGEGVAYHDTTAGNSGGVYRTTGVDIAAASEGGYTIGWTAAGEWLKYSVNVAAAGSYDVQLRIASIGGATMHVGFSGNGISVPVTIPNTGGWQTWTTVSVPATLGAGAQVMTLTFDTAGVNVAVVTVSAATITSTSTGTGVGSSTPSSTGGNTIAVNAGGDFQSALNRAAPGDTIVLQAGATFSGNFILPAKSSSSTAYITITTSAPLSSLPGANMRIAPSYASLLPKIKSTNAAQALVTAPFAHHYRLQYLEMQANYQGLGDILDFGDASSNQNTLAAVPHDLIADHLYIHGDPTYGQKRAIGLNSAATTVSNSYISGIMAPGQDAQGICGWNGPGPFTITNNYIEAAGENVLFGGADPTIAELVPSDITITHNYFTKQMAWQGSSWSVKNLLEFKNAQRVKVNGNVFENNWAAAQVGYAILFTPRDQDGTAPWTIVQDIEFTNNIVRHVASAINVLGQDNIHPSQQTRNIVIRNNVFEDVSKSAYGGTGWFMLIVSTPEVTVDHNTVLADGSSDVFADGGSSSGFVFTNNIMQNNAWAIMGANASPGNGTIKMFFPGSLFQDNIIAAAPASTYPTGNFYPSLLSAAGFVNLSGGNYRLSSASSYRNAGTDGKDIGADIDAINAAAGTSY